MGAGSVVSSCCGRAKKHSLLWLHVAYFLLLSMLGALSLWASPKPTKLSQPLSFVDALFTAVSAVTETGLGSVEMHRFSLLDQLTILLLMLVGSQVFTSAIPLFIASLFYCPRSPHPSLPSHAPCTHTKPQERRYIKRILSLPTILTSHPTSLEEATPSPFQAPSLHPICQYRKAQLHKEMSIPPSSSKCVALPSDSLTNKHCTHTTSIEYKALVTMSWVTTYYFVFSIMVGFLICQVSIICSPHALGVLRKGHVNSCLFSLFATVSAFGNCGFILLDENLVPLQRSMVMLLCLCALILMGNTLYAPTMRMVICMLYKLAKGERKQVYGYILNESRRRFTHLFPRKETAWLVGTVVVINAFQVMCILGLDWKSQALKELGNGYKFVVALFQAVVTRTGGMNAVNLSDFSTATLLVSFGSMYIASYPIYLIKKEMTKVCNGLALESRSYMLLQQLCKLRAQDSFLFLATLLICIFERDAIKKDPLNFSFFNIVFEVISGYANVGLSIGYSCGLKRIVTTTSGCTDTLSSFSGRWSVGSKLIMMVVMLLGRQRGLFEEEDWGISLSLS